MIGKTGSGEIMTPKNPDIPLTEAELRLVQWARWRLWYTLRTLARRRA
jgi:hypothetical protein